MTSPVGGTNSSASLAQILASSKATTADQAKTDGIAVPNKEIGKDAFLKLLVAQLKYQDPANPAQGTEFLSQTAQFTQVEKLSDLADVQKQMLTAQLTLGAGSLIGRTVTYTDASGNEASGVVSGATVGTSPSVHIGAAEGGFDVDLAKVSRVNAGGAGTPTATPALNPAALNPAASPAASTATPQARAVAAAAAATAAADNAAAALGAETSDPAGDSGTAGTADSVESALGSGTRTPGSAPP
jgi:flagellar basal-body rod modification protein FlgD